MTAVPNFNNVIPYAVWSKELRKRGFQKSYDSRAGGCRTVIFEKQIDIRRRVDVQIWGDGEHRACSSFDGCSDTHPTDFVTIEEMDAAIEHEATRMDSSYSQRGSTFADRERLGASHGN